MPYCPVCRDEFQDWAKYCPDCGIALVDKLPPLPEQGKRHDPLVCIATAPNEAVAYMWAEILADHGIRCVLKGGDLKAAMYVFTYNLQYGVYVLASEAERAMEILTIFLEDNQTL